MKIIQKTKLKLCSYLIVSLCLSMIAPLSSALTVTPAVLETPANPGEAMEAKMLISLEENGTPQAVTVRTLPITQYPGLKNLSGPLQSCQEWITIEGPLTFNLTNDSPVMSITLKIQVPNDQNQAGEFFSLMEVKGTPISSQRHQLNQIKTVVRLLPLIALDLGYESQTLKLESLSSPTPQSRAFRMTNTGNVRLKTQFREASEGEDIDTGTVNTLFPGETSEIILEIPEETPIEAYNGQVILATA